MVTPEELDKEIEALVAERGKDLERYLRGPRVRLPEHIVGDVINDALLVIVDKRRRGHTLADPGSYLFAVARNAAIDRLRTRYAGGTPGLGITSDHQDGHDMLAAAEASFDLRNAIRQLPRRQRQIIELRYLRDFTVEETARILNIAKGTVGPATAAALRRLKTIMTEQGSTWEGQIP